MTSPQHIEAIGVGSVVEVWNRSLGQFGGRFEVAQATPTGIRVRRTSEPTPLPATFTPDEVRLLRSQPSQPLG